MSTDPQCPRWWSPPQAEHRTHCGMTNALLPRRLACGGLHTQLAGEGSSALPREDEAGGPSLTPTVLNVGGLQEPARKSATHPLSLSRT